MGDDNKHPIHYEHPSIFGTHSLMFNTLPQTRSTCNQRILKKEKIKIYWHRFRAVPSVSTASVVISVFKALTNLNQLFIYLKELWITLRNSITLQTLVSWTIFLWIQDHGICHIMLMVRTKEEHIFKKVRLSWFAKISFKRILVVV